MKAIVLTYSPLKEYENKLLKETKIFKLALNHHAEDLNPDKRIITDYVLPNMCKKFPNKTIISVREHLRYSSKQIEYFDTEFKGATIIAAIEYLISKNYKNILIIGNNNVNSAEFKNLVKTEIDKLQNFAQIYQYSNGNFNLPQMSVSEFCKF